ncbi:MAG TPA: hypothetical protein VH496_11600 [Mycobacterium sp.]|jgi:hypothetical protein
MTSSGEHLSEEPQSERGAPGSRDTGENRAAGGPAERPEGAVEGAEEVPAHGGSGNAGTGEMPPQDTSSALPPYEGRQTSASGTAPGPKTASEYSSPAPGSTPGGATASPADEQPAAESGGDREPDMTGPSHTPGTRRAEG